MPRFVTIGADVYNVSDILSVSKPYKDTNGTFHVSITFRSHSNAESFTARNIEEYNRVLEEIRGTNKKEEYKKEKLRLMEKLIQAIEDNTLAHSYAPGGAIASKAEEDFSKKALGEEAV